MIIQPPPNITGSLHLGHAQRTTVEDLMVRHARMVGHPALFLPGLDHASIAAQFVLDGILAKEGESRASLGRERYLARMETFVAETRQVILMQQRRLGGSCDWGRLRYTMDEVSAKAVRVAFERLYRDDLAYRTEALINWCPGCKTSVSDLEVIPTPETGTLWRVRYHLIDEGTGEPDPGATITVATTRPETILGDTAVAVHPDDPRYAALVGRRVRIPFVERDVPIIADAVVDPAFGTGAVKITPAHDHDDHETGLRHGLAAPTILDDEARVAGTGTEFDGLDRYEARAGIVAALEASGDLAGQQAHEMVIGRCQRSDDVVEPRLKTQWFIRTKPLADTALEATRSGETAILPPRFEKTWEHWMTNIRDWNVSRQLWWGHRIPAWYCPDGHVTVTSAPDGPDACEVCRRPARELVQDPDIFDTWFSSGLWPFSTLGWPDPTEDYRRYYPGTVMETGYDILFFWVARMMMLGLHLTDAAPFRTIYLSGLIRDPYGQKMSKTKGNTVDPLGTIDDVGADALRFAMVHGTTPGNDQRFGPAKVEHARNFANKLWNATRYVLGARPATIPDDAERRLPDATHLGPADRWVLSRAAATVAAVDRAMADFNFGEVTRLLYDAIWSEYCDWGLELAKVRLADDQPKPGGARGHLVGAGGGARHVPAPAPSGDAVHHRAAVAGAAAPGRRPGPVDRRPLAGRNGPRRDRRGRGRRARGPRAGDPQRPRRREGRARRLAAPRRVRRARARPRAGVVATGDRAARTRSPAAPPPHPRGPPRDRRRDRRAGRDRGPGRGDRRPPDRRSRRRGRGPSEAREGARGHRAPARGRPCAARERRVHVEGASGDRRGRARERGGARRPGRAPARPARTLSGATRVDRPSRVRRPGSPSLHAGAATICPSCPLASGGAVPLEFLKRRGGDADQPAQASTAKVAPGVPEEVVAQEYQLKLYYAGKSSEGVRLKAGPRALAELPSMLAGIAKSDVEVVEPLPLEFSQALPSIVRPSEAMQWLNAHHQLNPVTRHALVVLESIDAIDLAFDTFACGLLDGETDTSDYPEYNAVVGGVASHWDEATGDMIVRAVVGWGGRGVRGDTDRIASRILGGLLTNILANQFALGLTAVERPVPAAGRGGLVCAHCGFASGHERAFYCPKCGMRLLRG